jgi:iron complex transport system substrate-binding protein
MTICSLLPSATEIVCELGLIDQLVAVSHECDFPPEIRSKAVITSSRLGAAPMTSAEIDKTVSERLHQHSGIYALDEELLARLKPDIILTQELCDVCAVSYEQVTEAVKRLNGDQVVLSLEPASLPGILATIEAVGAATGRAERAEELVAGMRSRIGVLAETGQTLSRRMRMACLEWVDPPFSAGHWVPEMVQVAGGLDVLAAPGDQSRRLSWNSVIAANPEIVVLMPCGFEEWRAIDEYRAAALPEHWSSVPAVQAGNVFVVDANAFFSRPGPRVIRGIEILQELLLAADSGADAGEGWARARSR